MGLCFGGSGSLPMVLGANRGGIRIRAGGRYVCPLDHRLAHHRAQRGGPGGFRPCPLEVENENNNTLKTKGYHLEHNFGHGQQHLSALLAAMNILAFLFHTVLGFTDEHYRLIRATLPTRKTFFQDLRALTRYLHFPSWEGLLRFMMRGLEIGPYAKPA